MGAIWMPSINTRINATLSSGFRAPNIDDVTRIFESSTAIKRVVIPNAELGPEYTYNADLGFNQRIKEKIRFGITAFCTLFRNAITTAPFQLNGQDSILYNGVTSAVYASQNVNRAYLYGVSGALRFDFSDAFFLDNTFSYTYGRINVKGKSQRPWIIFHPFLESRP